MDDSESPNRRRCRPDELCTAMFDAAALSDCGQSGGHCDCPRGYVLQHGTCVGQLMLLLLFHGELKIIGKYMRIFFKITLLCPLFLVILLVNKRVIYSR